MVLPCLQIIHASSDLTRELLGCRGLATFPDGVPEPPGTLRQIWSDGRGVRVGISSLSATECFWFTTLSCPEVSARTLTPSASLTLLDV